MANKQSDARDIGLAVGIVCAYVQNNSVPHSELGAVVRTVHAALAALATGDASQAAAEPREPAVPVRKSVTPDFLVCLEDGRKLKSLKRHLTKLGLTPQEYRARWGLPADYPMVAPNYAKARSDLAKAIGLGVKGGRGRKPADAAPAAAQGTETQETRVAARSTTPGQRGAVRRSARVD